MSSEKGKILFFPLNSQGHINCCVSISKRFIKLYGDQAEIHFLLNNEFSEKIKKQLPQAIVHSYVSPEEKEREKTDKNWIVDIMQSYGQTWSEDSISFIQKSAPLFDMMLNSSEAVYDELDKIVRELKPNLIIYDNIFTSPVGMNQGIPWANLFSAAMSYIGLPKIPPPQSALPAEYTPENEKIWNEYIEKAYKTEPWLSIKKKNEDFLKRKNVEGLDKDSYMPFKISPHLNIYVYPEALDYSLDRPIKLPGGPWLRIETPVEKPFPDPYPIPEKLKNKPGKLIYFSLGSMASSYRPLMVKILEILSQLPHRFIVSKGMIGHEFDSLMGDNMDGEDYLNQFAVLQTVDMVFSHGGNNTLTETFNFGKPLIIGGLFGDQKCNSQRVLEKGLGRRINLFAEKDQLKKDLEEAIEFCSQESVVSKMKAIAERIQKDNGIGRVCEELMKYCKK